MADDTSAPDLAALRREYGDHGLDVPDLEPDPIAMFRRWFDDTVAARLHEPNAMVVSTVSADGRPSSRMVLLKGVDERGFVFFTNYESRKAARSRPTRRLAAVPVARPAAAGARRGDRGPGVGGGERGLLRQPAARVRSSVPGRPRSRGWWRRAPALDERLRRGAGPVRRDGRRAGAAALGRVPGHARGGRVLAGPARGGCTTGCATGTRTTRTHPGPWTGSRRRAVVIRVRVRGPASRPAAFSPLGAARCALAARPCRTGRGCHARYGRSLSQHALVRKTDCE